MTKQMQAAKNFHKMAGLNFTNNYLLLAWLSALKRR